MSYEDYLVARREATTTDCDELKRISRLKTVAREVDANHHLSEWLERFAGAITVITDQEDAVAEVTRLKASGDVIGIDIETGKAAAYVDHPQAGLHPKASTWPGGSP